MKKYFILFVSIFLYKIGVSQALQASIAPGGSPNSIYVKVKSKSIATSPSVPISTVNFCIQIRDTLPLPKPTLSITEILPSTGVGTYAINDVSVETPGYYTWNIDGTDGTTVTAFTANQEITFIEIFFNGGPSVTTYSRLVHIPDGGSTGASTFYLSIGGIPQIIENELMYGPTAINNTTGIYPLGSAVVTLPGLVLPVKFLGFNVTKKNNDALLSWQIENESNLTDRYEIERSLNGVDFIKFYTVLPKNNGSSGNIYDLTDMNLTTIRAAGVFYYRVKQIDKDGQFIYSPIRNLRLNSKEIAIGVYPNPVKESANVTIDLEQDADATITVTDASGKLMQSMQTQLFKGLNNKKINMAAFASGRYLLKVQTTVETKTMAVVKAK